MSASYYNKRELMLKKTLLENGVKPSGPGAKGLLPTQLHTLLCQPYMPLSSPWMKGLPGGHLAILIVHLHFWLIPQQQVL